MQSEPVEEIDVARVPKRETGMSAYEVMLSESQERMLLVAAKGREREVIDVFEKWDLHAEAIGTVTEGGTLRVYDQGKLEADVPTAALTDEAPVYDRPWVEPVNPAAAEDVLALPASSDAGAVLVVDVDTARSRVPEGTRLALHERIRAAVAMLPGVSSAGLSRITPVSGAGWSGPIELPDRPDVGTRDR